MENSNFAYNYTQSGYIVDFKLSFSSVFGKFDAMYSYVRQTLVLDSNFWIKNIFHCSYETIT